MKFSETANAKTLNVVGFPEVFIYYLLKNEEVVYVGQTTQGLSRPFSHIHDKDFDEVKIIGCKNDDLNSKEAKAITKYKPKYNKIMIDSYSIYPFKKMLKARYYYLGCEDNFERILLEKMNIKSKHGVLSVHTICEIAKALGITLITLNGTEFIPKIQATKIIEKLDYLFGSETITF